MKIFDNQVNTESREDMIKYLKNHFRYYTMNSWNKLTSYANSLKIHSLGFSKDIEHKLYRMIGIEDFYIPIDSVIEEFQQVYNYKYLITFNGRSDGYLVLHKGKYDNRKVFILNKGIDQGEDFEDWEDCEIKERVKLVQDFDEVCNQIVKISFDQAKNKEIVDEDITLTKKIKRLRRIK